MSPLEGVAAWAWARGWHSAATPTACSFEPHWGEAAALVTLDLEQRPGFLVGTAVAPCYGTLPDAVEWCLALNGRCDSWQPLWMSEFEAWLPASSTIVPLEADVHALAENLLRHLERAATVLLEVGGQNR